MTDRYLLRHVIPAAYALLPPPMASAEATAEILAIGLTESDGLATRKQYEGGPARGFFQFERNGIRGVLTHRATRIDVQVALSVLVYPVTVDACYTAVEHNDVLAAVFARLLLWTLPRPLAAREDYAEGWRQYLEAWRPGAWKHWQPTDPVPAKWQRNYREAWIQVSQDRPH